MNPRVTLILVAVFAVLLGYVFFVEQNKTPEQLGTPAPTTAPEIFQFNTSNVKSLQVRDLRSTREVVLTRTDKGWQVDKPIQKAADSATVDNVVGQLVTLKATRVFTNVTDVAPFGFVTATVEARITMSNTTTYALTIGAKTPDSSGYYAVYTGDKSKVFIISSDVVDQMLGWLNTPPYEPTPTPTFTPTPPVTATITGTLTVETPAAATPGAATPNIVPTVALPTPAPSATP
ncbi:MAG: DUF4340 domain-containing protein [Chloroflexi bacterium]|nr:DUF4340 domain-containing protein [Chloroflexota bacterium]